MTDGFERKDMNANDSEQVQNFSTADNVQQTTNASANNEAYTSNTTNSASNGFSGSSYGNSYNAQQNAYSSYYRYAERSGQCAY